jgi:hypothetical protein
MTDQRDGLGRETGVHEFRQPQPAPVEHPEGGVAGIDELGGGADNAAEQAHQVEVRLDHEHGVEERLQLGRVRHLVVGHATHPPMATMARRLPRG